MSLVHRHCRVVASALLAVAALGTAPGVVCAQGTMGVEVRALERRSTELQRLHAERRRSVERGIAHAQMSDTMYASTPDPAPPPHSVPLDVKRPRPPSASGGRPAPRSAPSPGHRIALLVPASGASEYEGVVRLVNRSDASGAVRIEGFDDAGVRHGPVTVRLGAGEAVHLSATDLERGNGAKGLSGHLGSGEGDWRLELSSALALEVLGYVRTADGFLTAMHDVVPPSEAGHRVVRFNAGGEVAQASRLRLVNPGAQPVEVRIEGRDDAGASSPGAVSVTVPAGGARTLGAAELESGEGLAGALGTSSGRWRLLVSADRPIEVMSLLWSPSGHLANLSSVPDNAVPDEVGAITTYTVPLLPAASRFVTEGLQGFVRIINHSRDAGEVRIEAFDDTGAKSGPVPLAIAAHEAVELTAAELESGSPQQGLSAGVGTGEGDWWLRLTTGLDIEVLAYVQSQDGFVSPLHDVVPRAGDAHRVGVFNPASETSQASRLRLVNPDAKATEVRIEAVDDAGASSDGAVTLTLGGRAARTLGAGELESGDGEGLSGGLGDGTGRWRLLVSADAAIEVMSLLSDPGGHLANLSTAPGAGAAHTAEEVFAQRISAPVVQAKCVLCHTAGGVAGATRLHFEPASNPEHQALNLKTFADFIATVDDGADYLLNKVQGVGHGGGVQVAAGTPEFTAMERFLALLGEEEVTPAVALTPQTLFDTVTMAPTRKTLRRAALIFAGRNPTAAEYAAAERGGAGLRRTIRGLMRGPEFHEFLTRGANDRLLTDRNDGDVIGNLSGPFPNFINEYYRRVVEARDSGQTIHVAYDWNHHVQHGARRAPLELIAHVVENDLPYTEILTADYIMANPWAAAAYGASEDFDHPQALANKFEPTKFVTYYRKGEGYEREYDPVLGAARVLDPGPLITDYPHAGILNTMAFLKRYPTTATNRNRARSRWTYYHFLGLDIEKSASRTTDPVALADTNNPTLRNPACTVCHRILDPVAGAFQNYGDEGEYKDQWGGMDSLDEFYKKENVYRHGDTWYRDMRPPGFAGALAPNPDNSVQWLAQQIVADKRFAEAAVKFWWPAIMGSEVAEPPEDEGDTNFEGLLLAANAQGAEVTRLANGFRRGFRGRSAHNLKDLLVEIVLSKWFRADAVEDAHPVRLVALRDAGAKRLLTPEELARKTVALTGFQWGRHIRVDCAPPCVRQPNALTDRYRLLYGGIDSDGITERARDITSVMAGVAKRHAVVVSCPVVMREFYLLPHAERQLFAGIDQYVTPGSELSALFEIEAGSRAEKETLSLSGSLTPGSKTVKFFHTNDYNEPNAHRNIFLDRLVVRNATGRIIAHRELENLGPSGDCNRPNGDNFALWCSGWIDVPIDIPAAGSYEIEIVAWAEHAGDELPKLSIVVESETEGSGAEVVRAKLVELYDKLLGVQVTPHSPDVEAAFRLFVEVMERGREAQEFSSGDSDCYWNWLQDLSYFDGILEDAVVKEGEPGWGRRWFYDFDRPRVGDFMRSIDWSDPHYAAQAWAVVLAYLMTDYRYLYL